MAAAASFTAAFYSEGTKHRRTATPWLITLAPAGLVALSGWYSRASGEALSWPSLLALIFQLWTILCIPAGSALLAGLTADHETRAGDWRALRSRPVSAAGLYTAKLSALMAQALAATLLLCTFAAALAAVGGALAGASGEVPTGALLTAGLLSWLCALPLLAFQMWVAVAYGVGASVALGVPGLLAAALLGGTSLGGTGAGVGIWTLAPWAWPSRMSGQLLFLARDGGSAASVDAAFSSVLLVAAGALILTVVLSAAGALWFSHKEVG